MIFRKRNSNAIFLFIILSVVAVSVIIVQAQQQEQQEGQQTPKPCVPNPFTGKRCPQQQPEEDQEETGTDDTASELPVTTTVTTDAPTKIPTTTTSDPADPSDVEDDQQEPTTTNTEKPCVPNPFTGKRCPQQQQDDQEEITTTDDTASEPPVTTITDAPTTPAAEEEVIEPTTTPTIAADTTPPLECDESVENYAEKTVRDVLLERAELDLFRESADAVNLLDTVFNDPDGTVTVIAPQNHAIERSSNVPNLYWMQYLQNPEAWKVNLKHAVYNHIILGKALSEQELATGSFEILPENRMYGDATREVIGNVAILCSIQTKNGYVHVVGEIIAPELFFRDLSYLEVMPEFGPDQDVSQRPTLVDVVDFIVDDKNRSMYKRTPFDDDNNNGTTHIGCRLRAFNRINDYLKWTINGATSNSVLYGELLNETFKNESFHNFIEYNLIENRIYDIDAMELGYEELIMPSGGGCGAHMWVTIQLNDEDDNNNNDNNNNKICFNNACMVIAPPAFSPVGTPPERRIQYANNGIGYVVDKCLVCPGIAMLAEYAGDYTVHGVKELAQFLTASEWNLRNLSLDIGDGGPITLFAPISSGWRAFTAEDITRLSTDMWKPHQWDFLRHMMVQGNYTIAELKAMANATEDKNLDLTSLANQTLFFELDTIRDQIMLNCGDIYFTDIHGVDGMMHFVTNVPLPRSITHSVYDIGHWLGGHYEQLNLIDGIFLDSDMRRLEPITALYAPDLDWQNKIIELDYIEFVLKSHLFGGLLWCDRLREMAENRETLESQNGLFWALSVNEFNMPCFDTITDPGQEVPRACITECDHLARNGIVHVVDSVMLGYDIETRAPQPPLPEGATPPSSKQPDSVLDTTPCQSWERWWQKEDESNTDFSRPKRGYSWDEVENDPDFDESIGTVPVDCVCSDDPEF